MNGLKKVSLIEAPAAASVVVANGMIDIPGLPRIPFDMWSGDVTVDTNQTEVAQSYDVSLAATILSNTNYGFKLKSFRRNYNHDADFLPIRTRSAAVLSGTAATDKHNVYWGLANRINGQPSLSATAYPVVTVAYSSQSANFTVGKILTGGTSGAQGIILADTDAGTSGTLTVGMTTTTNFVVETITDNNGTPGSATGAVATLGVKLRIVCKGGYEVALHYYNFIGTVLGPLAIATDPLMNSYTTDVTSVTTGRTRFGLGSDLVNMRPVFEQSTDNQLTGALVYPGNATPLAASSYNFVNIKVKNTNSGQGIGDASGIKDNSWASYGVWANPSDGTNYNAFIAALNAIV